MRHMGQPSGRFVWFPQSPSVRTFLYIWSKFHARYPIPGNVTICPWFCLQLPCPRILTQKIMLSLLTCLTLKRIRRKKNHFNDLSKVLCRSNTPGAPLANFNDEGGGGGPTEVYILYPQNITTSEFVYPKKSLLFLAYPKKSLSPFFPT